MQSSVLDESVQGLWISRPSSAPTISASVLQSPDDESQKPGEQTVSVVPEPVWLQTLDVLPEHVLVPWLQTSSAQEPPFCVVQYSFESQVSVTVELRPFDAHSFSC
jgi:hypothetical protein